MACTDEPGLGPDDGAEAVVFSIQRYSIQDGPGIRTTVFLKGCPLRCAWCSNPESQSPYPEIMYRSHSCRLCGSCAAACSIEAITVSEHGHRLDREACSLCMDCVEACPAGALEISGRRMKLEDVVEEACRDEIFYTNSGGGVTLSGGEPLFQPEFSRRFLAACRERSIHTALDTTGHASWQIMRAVLEHTDLVLFDLKHLLPHEHARGTQVGNALILENLRKTLDLGDPAVWIRIPVIPRFSDDDHYLKDLALALGDMPAEKVSLLGHHQWARSKYEALGRSYPYGDGDSTSRARLESIREMLQARGVEATIDH